LSRLDPTSPSGQTGNPDRRRIATIVGVAVLAGLIAWFVTSSNREGGNPILGTASGDPKMVENAEVDTISSEVGHTVFWAGERPNTKIELRHDVAGNTHVRYLTGDAEPGDPAQLYLDIGTYPFEGGHSVISTMAREPGTTMVKSGDAVGFYDPERPTNIYLGFPDRPDFQVEVFHPDEDTALEVARGGDIVPMP
jgi:hypothetical protein